MRALARRLVVLVLFVLAFFTLVGATSILAEGSGGDLEALLYVLVGIAFVAAAVYLRARSGG